MRTVIHGKRRELGIGSADLVSLADAREKATELRKIARAGGDPDADRKAAAKAAAEAARRNLITFGKAAEALHATLLPNWKNKKHADTWISGMKLHAFPKLADKPIETITREDILRVLKPIWTNQAETGRRLRQRLRAVLQWAKDEGHFIGDNPVDLIGSGLSEVKKEENHLAAMPWRDVPAFWPQLVDRESVSSACLRFLILTAARSGEARGATWGEIDFDGAAWNIPGKRMKRDKPHRVPLSAEALAILEGMKGLDPVLCFPSPNRGKEGVRPLSDMAFKLLFNRMGASGFTTHGFRSAFRDWCSESAKADPELAEAALSHATGNSVVRAYARSDLFDRRRDLMEAWSRFATGQASGEVVQLVRA